MTNIGKLIVLEGGEGAGKTSIVAKLKEDLDNNKFVFIREPGGTELGNKVRSILLDGEVALSTESELLLFMASRFQIFELVVWPALLSGKHVIADRMDASTFAYQIHARKASHLESLFWLLRNLYLKSPDRDALVEPQYLLMDIDPELGIHRVVSGGREVNHLDRMSLSFHQKVQEGYHEFISRSSSHEIIDANRTFGEVYASVLKVISSSTTF